MGRLVAASRRRTIAHHPRAAATADGIIAVAEDEDEDEVLRGRKLCLDPRSYRALRSRSATPSIMAA
jgi:hypothetical protein